ncbi:MAG: polyprenyl synthetase family protein [Sedimentisphaerales bacterium]|nr:polyprenyl synthetase family protein [Sedimentisphaerales bacterium]
MFSATEIHSELEEKLRQTAQLVNNKLRELIKTRQMDDNLREVLRYCLEAPGKRVRPALIIWCCELIAGSVNKTAEIAAAAIEMVHTYSLVHDDLPAMDDDDFRRGLPTCHKAFDEATAILAGDALLTIAFEILSKEIDEPKVAVRLISELAEAAGTAGMIAGQLADLKAENMVGSEEMLRVIHTNKTAKMFRCAAAMGAIAGRANENEFNHLCEYGLKVGLAFQITDDILDVCGSSQQLGKSVGKDAKNAKCTYPQVMGLEKSKHLAKQLAEEAVIALEPLGPKAKTLKELVTALLNRTK